MATVKAIKYGMKGDDVSNLQTALKNAGYNVDVDGSFGSQTLAAVKQYQQANGLDADGMVGPQTQAKLFGNTSTPTNTSAGTNTGGAGSAASAATKVNYPDAYVPGTYTNTDPSQSETVLAARATIDSILAQQPVISQSKWQDQINGIIDQILNRKAFNYDFNEDALYKQYAEQYTRRGKLAMQDTMGQAAAMTGGYGSSYASTAGNQAYQEYLSQLNEVIPELYGMALDRYQMEGQDMYNQYSMLSAQEQQDYARQMDKYNMWRDKLNYATDRYDTEYGNAVNNRNFEYGVWADDENRKLQSYQTELQKAQFDADFAERIRQHNETMNYNKATDAQKAAENRVYTAIENGVMPSEADIKASGLDSKYVQELYNSYDDKKTESASEKTKAEAMDKIGTYIAAGMEVPKLLQKQAGLSDDDLAALVGASTNSSSSETALQHVGSMTYPEMEEAISGFIKAGKTEEARSMVDHLYDAGMISDEEYKKMLARYFYTNGNPVTDTTVEATKPTYSGGGGGIITERAW